MLRSLVLGTQTLSLYLYFQNNYKMMEMFVIIMMWSFVLWLIEFFIIIFFPGAATDEIFIEAIVLDSLFVYELLGLIEILVYQTLFNVLRVLIISALIYGVFAVYTKRLLKAIKEESQRDQQRIIYAQNI